MSLQTELQTARKKSNLTQEQVAEKLHVSRKTISSWETGRNSPDIETLSKLSEIYQIKFEPLLGQKEKVLAKNYKLKYKFNLVEISYYFNILFLFFNIFNLYDIFVVPFAAPLLTINILIYTVINPGWKLQFKKIFSDINSYFVTLTFALITIPYSIISLENIMEHKEIYLSGYIAGCSVRELFMILGFLIALYIKPKRD
ncbi:helix-turn-helix domain-containing protein [Fructilactobacillus sp. Tb1]|uniref:helix-turn-helix domain-containing protein n=1 Tax=Fructilactobacillus sp. Tb1 TaxID=3422304 RepID=UPI003D2E69B5